MTRARSRRPGRGSHSRSLPDPERVAAWELLVELSTRISLVDLEDNEGLAREALTSLFSLFGTTREILRLHGPDVARDSGRGNLSFGVIAVRLLNDVLRPRLDRWNLPLAAWEAQRPPGVPPREWEQSWEHHLEMRRDLRRARQLARPYVLQLADLAEVSEFAMAVLVPSGGQSRSDNQPGWWDHRRKDALKLGFEPQHDMVRWLSPGVLLRTAWKIIRLTERSADARTEMPALAAVPTVDLSSESGDVWFDYVADLGDAFDPTMAVAWTISRDVLGHDDFGAGDQTDLLPPEGLPRGRFLVMGGDEVYPFGNAKRYRNQTTGPYALALPDQVEPTTVLALPGNHDWYDGLDAFSEVFLQHHRYGGWQTIQEASWFGVRLPHGWWLWALDTGLHGDLNPEQRAYFAALAAQMADGDRLIVASPVPAWRLREGRSDANVTDDELGRIRDFLSEVLPGGVTNPLCVAGDTHIYAHYVQDVSSGGAETHHITSGGGGAFLHPTHNLAPTVPQSTVERNAYTLVNNWPPATVSRHALADTTSGLMFDRQILPLASLLAIVHLVFTTASGGLMRAWVEAHHDDALLRTAGTLLGRLLASPGTWVGLVIVMAVCVRVVPQPNVAEREVQRAARYFGFLHGLAQAAVFTLAAAIGGMAIRLMSGPDGPSWVNQLAGTALGIVVGGLASTLVFGHHLRLVNYGYRIHDNEAFSGRHIRGFKHFLRCRIDEAGNLRLFVVGLESVRSGWAKALADGERPPTTTVELIDVIDLRASAPAR